ncbi:hypothetical protein GCM10027037_23260 [Mucilaginibacter koreensis]
MAGAIAVATSAFVNAKPASHRKAMACYCRYLVNASGQFVSGLEQFYGTARDISSAENNLPCEAGKDADCIRFLFSKPSANLMLM